MKFSHPLPPFAEQPEMGSANARSSRAIRMGLMRAGAIEQRANHGRKSSVQTSCYDRRWGTSLLSRYSSRDKKSGEQSRWQSKIAGIDVI
jgi:hypothetical protein